MRISDSCPSLFPEYARPEHSPKRVSGSPVRSKEQVRAAAPQLRPLDCKSVLNQHKGARLPFRWSLNPYRGCEFGCSYCFARHTHRYLGHDPAGFEGRIYVKYQAPEILSQTLSSAAGCRGAIAIGTATDPYQPAEARFEVTRRMLDVFSRYPGLSLSITTKSKLIRRDRALLRCISKTSQVRVQISLITLNPSVTRILEPRAPSPEDRLETIRRLSECGLEVGLYVMPILPGITDSTRELAALLRTAKSAGARWACCDLLRLSHDSWTMLGPVIESHFPWLVNEYARLLDAQASSRRLASESRARSFEKLREEAGLGAEPEALERTDTLFGQSCREESTRQLAVSAS